MASTSRSKKRKFEEKKKTDIRRTCDINLGTGDSGGVQSSLDVLNKQCEKSIQARCSPTRFVNLCRKLKDEFRMAVSEMGFSSLLEMSSCTIFRPLVGWLIQNFNVEDASLSVHGKSFMLTPLSFEMVMGLKDGGEDFEQRGSQDDVRRRQEAVRDGNATIKIERLEEELSKAKSVDDLFITRFVLFTIGTLLMPTTSLCVGTSMVGSINGLESVRKKNWATKSFTYLVDAIRDFKEKKGAFVGGCVLFLQVFYLHHLEGHSQYIDRSILPIAAWTEKKSKDVVTWIKDGFGYQSKKIRMRTDDGCYKCRSTNSDMIDMMTEIKECKIEIQELKQFVSGLQQSIREDVKKEISKMMRDLVESFKSNREGGAGEDGGGRIVRHHIIALDGDESESTGSRSWNTHPRDVRLKAGSIAMYKDFVCGGGYKIGPFNLIQPLFDLDSKKIAMYIFDGSLDQSEKVAQFGYMGLFRDDLQNFSPGGRVSTCVVDSYASLLTSAVAMQNRECWFLQSSLSMEAQGRRLEGMLNNMNHYNFIKAFWRKSFGNLSKYTKIVIPVLHMKLLYWSTAVVDLRKENVVLWDSKAYKESVHDLKEMVKEMLRILDHVLANDIRMTFPNGLSLQSFEIFIHERYVQQDDNNGGIYTMKRMWAASKGMDSIPEFNPEDFRLQLAIELVNSPFNEIRAFVLKKCSSHFDSLVRQAGSLG